VNAVTQDMLFDLPAGVDPLAAALGVCARFTAHMGMLTSQFSELELSDDDVEQVEEAFNQALVALTEMASVAIGLEREVDGATCTHYTVLNDAEWAPLADGAHARADIYACELEAGHPAPHFSLAQAMGGTDDSEYVWVRWSRGRKAVVADVPPCPAETVDPDDGDSWLCQLPCGHPGKHSFEMDQPADLARQPKQEILDKMNELLAAHQGPAHPQ
jgi:hypothetical protein